MHVIHIHATKLDDYFHNRSFPSSHATRQTCTHNFTLLARDERRLEQKTRKMWNWKVCKTSTCVHHAQFRSHAYNENSKHAKTFTFPAVVLASPISTLISFSFSHRLVFTLLYFMRHRIVELYMGRTKKVKLLRAVYLHIQEYLISWNFHIPRRINSIPSWCLKKFQNFLVFTQISSTQQCFSTFFEWGFSVLVFI